MHKFLLCLVCVVATSAWADSPTTRLLVVVGLVKEAKVAQGNDMTLLVSSANSERLAEHLRNEDVRDVHAIVSFGVAGGLHPELKAGDVIVPDAIKKGDQTWFTDPSLTEKFRQRLQAQGLTHHDGTIAGADSVAATPQDKAKKFAETGAKAVDMESHIAAAWAAENGIPFGVIRVVSDAAHRSLPLAALNALTAEGEVRLLPILTGVLKDLRQVRQLVHAGIDSRKAFSRLAQCQALLNQVENRN